MQNIKCNLLSCLQGNMLYGIFEKWSVHGVVMYHNAKLLWFERIS